LKFVVSGGRESNLAKKAKLLRYILFLCLIPCNKIRFTKTFF